MKQSTRLILLASAVAIAAMMLISPSHIGAFLNLPGLVVVFGGTLIATFLSRPTVEVMAVLRSIPALLREEPLPAIKHDIDQLLQFASRYRVASVRNAERELSRIKNPFVRAGLQQVVDRAPEQELEKTLHWRLSSVLRREQGRIQIINTMAIFAPAFGMLGTLFGLVNMLSGLGESGLQEIGGSMAFAMITTVYGIIAANLLFKPLAIKLERRTSQRLMQMKTLMEGILMIYHKRHPAQIRDVLESIQHGATNEAEAERQPNNLTLVGA
ncbi:chemotaxis protein MotA [Thiogranum longum]|uniref:Chemotaxis protein MotA n=1 Tax=Thiogranum longum TaxID=1537524 RepID=A0A4R1H8A7_9GAMM|nr:MotA/TolQ/ExbB proton channel family protein [Thiogranum longum]TCK18074.1 chemotaxis protein MotA [Thiogranum longum]